MSVTPYAIRIIPPTDTTPSVGQTISFLCELRQDGQYTSPIWRLPSGLPVSPRGFSKLVYDIKGVFHKDSKSNVNSKSGLKYYGEPSVAL